VLNNWAWRILVICEEIFLFAKLNIGFDFRENRVALDFCDTEEGFLVFKIPCSLYKGQKQWLQEEVTYPCPVVLVFFGILLFPSRLQQSLPPFRFCSRHEKCERKPFRLKPKKL
jgi:hypothetical protein